MKIRAAIFSWVALTVGVPAGAETDPVRKLGPGRWPCDARVLGVRRLKALASLSSFGVAVTPGARALHVAAEQCVNADAGHVSVALQVPARALFVLRSRCRGGLRCPLRAGSLLGGRLPDRSGWFAACVPIACLGRDSATRKFSRHVLRQSFVGSAKTRIPIQPTADLRVLRLFGNADAPPVAEVSLSDESLSGLGDDVPFEIVTVTDAPEHAEALRTSVPWPLHLRFLKPPASGGGKPWKFRWFDAERYLLAFVSSLRQRGLGDRLVIYSDAFDTAWIGCRRNLSHALDLIGSPVFFGAEFGLHPAGLPGYPMPVTSYQARAMAGPAGLRRCREVREVTVRWDVFPPDEHEPCLAVDDRASGFEAAVFLNGGVYGGRAKDLEGVLRRLLSRQVLLSELGANGEPYQNHGRTHQYLWSQYFLDRPEEVGLDYGGAFVVNLAPKSVVPRLFGMSEHTGLMHSVLFQRPVCLAHANGGGFSDSTLQAVRAAVAFRYDTTAFVGVPHEFMDHLTRVGVLRADLDNRDRIVVDTSLCIGPPGLVSWWRGILTYIDILTVDNFAALHGLQFLVLRPEGRKTEQSAAFKIVSAQHQEIFIEGVGPPPNATGEFVGRFKLDLSNFLLEIEQDDCLGWRCGGRCDLTYEQLGAGPLPPSEGAEGAGPVRRRGPGGVWLTQGRDAEVGSVLHFEHWLPQTYSIGVEAEVYDIGFYQRPLGV